MANGKIEYSKPELLDLGGVGEVTFGADWCSRGSIHISCSDGNTNPIGGCAWGNSPVSMCRDGTGARLPYQCYIGDAIS